jgi:hypothetical protein
MANGSPTPTHAGPRASRFFRRVTSGSSHGDVTNRNGNGASDVHLWRTHPRPLRAADRRTMCQTQQRREVLCTPALTRLSLLKKKAKGHIARISGSIPTCASHACCVTEGQRVSRPLVKARQVAGTAMGEQARRGSRDHSEGKRTILVTSRLNIVQFQPGTTAFQSAHGEHEVRGQRGQQSVPGQR